MAETQQGKRKRFLFVMVDGLGDVGIPALNNRTPLQHAVTPAMDALATAGRNGLMDPVEVGLACGSDTAHLSILGYPPRTYVDLFPFSLLFRMLIGSLSAGTIEDVVHSRPWVQACS